MKTIAFCLVGLVGLSFCFSVRHIEFRTPETSTQLGEKLFFDPILSLDQRISCASCHRPEAAFADTLALSLGVGNKTGLRNAPSVMNMASRPYFFYDGRAASLEEQALGPIENPVEMHLAIDSAVRRLNNSSVYLNLFQLIFSERPSKTNLTKALADFQRRLESDGSAPHDRWIRDSTYAHFSESQQRGRTLFLEKGKCFDCHFGPDFTGDEFRNIGLYDEKTYFDKGRFDETLDSADLGRFKVPGLRNVALTAPFMHDGSLKTLEDVVAFYSNPYAFVETPINIDTLIQKPLHLSENEQVDLVNFLHSLTDKTTFKRQF
ncbi:MAG: cytochrome-c peroxidase [Flavobacteriales bacterium]